LPILFPDPCVFPVPGLLNRPHSAFAFIHQTMLPWDSCAWGQGIYGVPGIWQPRRCYSAIAIYLICPTHNQRTREPLYLTLDACLSPIHEQQDVPRTGNEVRWAHQFQFSFPLLIC
jgi:hypothetical protein